MLTISLNIFMNNFWFLISLAASIEETIKNLNLNKDVENFLLNIENKRDLGIYFSILKEDRNIGLENLKQRFLSKKEEVNLKNIKKEEGLAKKYTKEELDIIDKSKITDEKLKYWTLNELKNKKYLTKDSLIVTKLQYINDFYNKLKTINSEKFFDNERFQIENFSLAQVLQYAKEFKENEKFYTQGYNPVEQNKIMYKFKDGWFIVELKSEHDLKVEGKLLNHCVANYANQVENDETRIFSLRDQNNKPHATIETDYGMYVFKQEFGKGNSTLDEELSSRVKEWKTKIHPMSEVNQAIRNFKIMIENPGFVTENTINGIPEIIGLLSFLDYNIPENKQIIDKITNMFARDYEKIYKAILNNKTISEDLLLKLSDISTKEYVKIAMHPNSGREILSDFINFTYVGMSQNIGKYPDLVVKILSGKNNDEQKAILLSNPSIPSKIISNYFSSANDEDLKYLDDTTLSSKTIDELLKSNTNVVIKISSLISSIEAIDTEQLVNFIRANNVNTESFHDEITKFTSKYKLLIDIINYLCINNTISVSEIKEETWLYIITNEEFNDDDITNTYPFANMDSNWKKFTTDILIKISAHRPKLLGYFLNIINLDSFNNFLSHLISDDSQISLYSLIVDNEITLNNIKRLPSGQLVKIIDRYSKDSDPGRMYDLIKKFIGDDLITKDVLLDLEHYSPSAYKYTRNKMRLMGKLASLVNSINYFYKKCLL